MFSLYPHGFSIEQVSSKDSANYRNCSICPKRDGCNLDECEKEEE